LSGSEGLANVLYWCRINNLTTNSVNDPSLDFHLSIFDKDQSVEILHSEREKPFIILASRFVPSDELQKKLLALTANRKTELLFEIANMLTLMDVSFLLVGPDKTFPINIEITKRLFLKEGTPQTFYDSFMSVKGAAILAANIELKYSII
jgi:hypothetical protein